VIESASDLLSGSTQTYDIPRNEVRYRGTELATGGVVVVKQYPTDPHSDPLSPLPSALDIHLDLTQFARLHVVQERYLVIVHHGRARWTIVRACSRCHILGG